MVKLILLTILWHEKKLWLPHFRTFCELVEGEENKLTTFSTWIIMLGCNESNIIFQQHLCKLGQLRRSNGRNSQVPTGHYLPSLPLSLPPSLPSLPPSLPPTHSIKMWPQHLPHPRPFNSDAVHVVVGYFDDLLEREHSGMGWVGQLRIGGSTQSLHKVNCSVCVWVCG